MKKRVIPAWFGEITQEEIDEIAKSTEAFETMITAFQKRPIEAQTDSDKNNDNNK